MDAADERQMLKMRHKLIMRKTESPATRKLKEIMEYKVKLAFVETITKKIPDDGQRTIHTVRNTVKQLLLH